jgi:16S rRNA (adenine1518-N6/adenine1519-N6)-dimethyltransferase
MDTKTEFKNNVEILDQHFMIDKELLNRIVDYANLSSEEIVLEIGPGKGVLTDLLVKKCRVTAIEKDERLAKELEKKYFSKNKHNNKIKILCGNALEILMRKDFDKIVSNIPYCISEPLIKKILIKQPELVILTTGKNFIEVIKSNKLVNLIYDFEVLEIIEREAFEPMPKTQSAVLKFTLKDDLKSRFFRRLLRQYDKKLKNALIDTLQLDLTKRQVKEKVKDLEEKNKSILVVDRSTLIFLEDLFDSIQESNKNNNK